MSATRVSFLPHAVSLLALAFHGHEETGSEENTGGTSVFVAPGFRSELTPWLALSAYLQLPIYQRTNGTQLVAPSQFWIGTTYTLP